MMRYTLIITTLIATMSLKKCDKMDESFTLNIPKKGFEVIQNVPVNKEGRDKTLCIYPQE